MSQPTKDNKTALGYSALLSSVSLGLIKNNPFGWDVSNLEAIAIITPIVITTLVTLAYWGFALLNGKTTDQITLERQWDNRIKFLEERIKLSDNDQDLIKELKEVTLARSKIFTPLIK